MKQIASVLLGAGLLAALLVACGTPVASSTPTSHAASAVSQASQVPASTASATSAASGKTDDLLKAIEPAAALGATLPLTELDLTASGDVSAEDVLAVSGAQSNLYSQNGGIVYVVQAQPGKAKAVEEGLLKMKQALLAQGENYKAEFPVAYANIEGTLVVVKGDYVVYATAADGNYTALNEAITAAFTAI